MKRFILIAALAASISQAHAAEVSLPLDDNAQQGVFQLPALLDACIAGMALRNDPTTCKAVSGALYVLTNMVQKAQADAKAAATAKAAADKAAAEKPALQGQASPQ